MAGFAARGRRSHLGSKAMEHATVAFDEGVDEAASEHLECCCLVTREQEVAECILDVTRIDEEGGGTSMEVPLALRVVRVESVPQQVSEQMVVPVGVSGQLDEEEVPLVDTAEQIGGVASLGHGGAALRVEHVEDGGREQEVEDLRRLSFEDLRSEEVCDGAWRLRELGEEKVGDWFVAKGQRSHLDASGPTLSTVREQLDLGLAQLDSELVHDRGHFVPGESKFGIAHLEELPVRAKSVQRELGLTSAAHNHTAARRKALDERGHARRRSRRELEVVDHDHDRLSERREVVHDRDRNVAELGLRLVEQIGGVEPTVGPPSSKRGGERRPERDGIGVAVVARKPDRQELRAMVQPRSERHTLSRPGRTHDDRQRSLDARVESTI